jgi:hypothetical protein
MIAPSVSSVVRSAFRSGGLRSASWRSSKHSFSLAVAVCVFAAPAAAAAFARRWARRLGVAVTVRGCAVSVPVSAPLGCLPWVWSATAPRAGGVAGLARACQVLAVSGLVGFGRG